MSSDRPTRVLLMEDDAGMARLCRKRLEREGYVVEHASDGEQGLSMCSKGGYDVLILDNSMPVYDGLEVLRRLATSPQAMPATVMVTGSGNEEVAVQALRQGARDYVIKDIECHYLDLLPAVIERAMHLQRMEAQLRLVGRVFESVSEGILVTDPDGRIVSINGAFTAMTGYSAQEAVGQNPRLLKSGRHDADFYKAMWAALPQAGRWEGEVWNRRKDGAVYPAWLTISRVEDERGAVTNYVGVLTDISARKQAEERLSYLATHDPLTGLANRSLFLDSLAHGLALARRGNRRLGLMMLDLDGFKKINDARGHKAGDLVLQEVARRLAACQRESDVVARLGGDEFTVILFDISEDPRDAAGVAERVLRELSKPFELDGSPCTITASIGISLFPLHGDEADTLLRCADSAMYRAKKGRNRYEFHVPLPESPLPARP